MNRYGIEIMDKSDSQPIIYDSSVIDFVTVAVEFCAFLERETPPPREEWMDKMLKILPLLYIKASLLPETVPMHNEEVATFVREEDYTRVSLRVEEVMGEENTYLDVFMDEMRYSDTPVSAFVSENIADIYQDVRNLVSIYQFELTDQMNDALHRCVEHFHTYWGQRLVNVLRPLHMLKSKEWAISDEDDLNGEESWD